MNLFQTSHALLEIEISAKEHGVTEGQMAYFFMWLSDDRFPRRDFDDALVKELLDGMEDLVREWEAHVERELAQAASSSLLEPF